jgi:hypothetical protein
MDFRKKFAVLRAQLHHKLQRFVETQARTEQNAQKCASTMSWGMTRRTATQHAHLQTLLRRPAPPLFPTLQPSAIQHAPMQPVLLNVPTIASPSQAILTHARLHQVLPALQLAKVSVAHALATILKQIFQSFVRPQLHTPLLMNQAGYLQQKRCFCL